MMDNGPTSHDSKNNLEEENAVIQEGASTDESSSTGESQGQTRWEHGAEIVITIILALATVATAWSGYQAARWGGVQSTKYSEAGALRVESPRASNTPGQLTQIDIGLFTNWVNAFATDNLKLADFYEQRFRPEFKPAFEAWIATEPRNNPGAPPSPFSMPEYQVSLAEEAIQLEAEAARTFDEGKVANQTSDDYILNTVILASVLFLSGIASRFQWLPVRIAIIIFGLIMLAIGLFNVATYPIN
jgi:hypothetical protein